MCHRDLGKRRDGITYIPQKYIRKKNTEREETNKTDNIFMKTLINYIVYVPNFSHISPAVLTLRTDKHTHVHNFTTLVILTYIVCSIVTGTFEKTLTSHYSVLIRQR